jgi:hypothetical protein
LGAEKAENMELIKRVMPDNYTIFDCSCWHYGALSCWKSGIDEIIETVKQTPNGFLMHKGDFIEAITPNDKRFASCSIDPALLTPQAQMKQVEKVITPIKEQILFVGLGNHEYSVINTVNLSMALAENLEVPYGGVLTKFISLNNRGKVDFKILSCHGRGSLPRGAKDEIQREGNRKAALKAKLAGMGFSDVIVMGMGHDHSALFVVEPTIDKRIHLIDKGGKVKQVKKQIVKQNASEIDPSACWYTICGSMLKTYSDPGSGVLSYSEMHQYPPAPMGYIKIEVRDRQVVNVEAIRM